jgi:hypothetical protein
MGRVSIYLFPLPFFSIPFYLHFVHTHTTVLHSVYKSLFFPLSLFPCFLVALISLPLLTYSIGIKRTLACGLLFLLLDVFSFFSFSFSLTPSLLFLIRAWCRSRVHSLDLVLCS